MTPCFPGAGPQPARPRLWKEGKHGVPRSPETSPCGDLSNLSTGRWGPNRAAGNRMEVGARWQWEFVAWGHGGGRELCRGGIPGTRVGSTCISGQGKAAHGGVGLHRPGREQLLGSCALREGEPRWTPRLFAETPGRPHLSPSVSAPSFHLCKTTSKPQLDKWILHSINCFLKLKISTLLNSTFFFFLIKKTYSFFRQK